MGSLLLCAGAPGTRKILPNSRVMIHQPRYRSKWDGRIFNYLIIPSTTTTSGGMQGVAADIAIHAKEILDLRARLNDIYVSHTGKALADIEKAMERDYFLNAEQAVAFGLVDSVTQVRKGKD